jgi:hypothetical protein
MAAALAVAHDASRIKRAALADGAAALKSASRRPTGMRPA